MWVVRVCDELCVWNVLTSASVERRFKAKTNLRLYIDYVMSVVICKFISESEE